MTDNENGAGAAIDLDELERIAKAAVQGTSEMNGWDYLGCFSPPTVLALLTRLRAAEANLSAEMDISRARKQVADNLMGELDTANERIRGLENLLRDYADAADMVRDATKSQIPLIMIDSEKVLAAIETLVRKEIKSASAPLTGTEKAAEQ
jgi:hypothetical protein